MTLLALKEITLDSGLKVKPGQVFHTGEQEANRLVAQGDARFKPLEPRPMETKSCC